MEKNCKVMEKKDAFKFHFGEYYTREAGYLTGKKFQHTKNVIVIILSRDIPTFCYIMLINFKDIILMKSKLY